MNLQGKTVVVSVTGSIAAYWVPEIIWALKVRNADVRVVMTGSAQKFITPLTLQIISGNPVLTDLFTNNESCVRHIEYARRADIIIIAPATANIIGKLANGIADDTVSSIALASTSPIIVCPAMNNMMWLNKIVQNNIMKLKKNNFHIVKPEYGEMVCGGMGTGRLAQIESIIMKVKEALRTRRKIVREVQ